MNLKILNNYYSDENTYFIYNEKTAVVIDPGNDLETILKTEKDCGVKIKYIMVTHCHYDHIICLEELRKETGALLISSENGVKNLANPDINLTALGLGKAVSVEKPEIVLADGQIFNADGMEFQAIYTPGHTDCGVCYKLEDSIFVGDTLFLRSCGRWDLPTGDEEALIKSVKEKLYTLDENLTLYPGHGNKTSIGYEKKFNMFIKA